MAAVTICSDFGAQENKVYHCQIEWGDWKSRLPSKHVLILVIISNET